MIGEVRPKRAHNKLVLIQSMAALISGREFWGYAVVKLRHHRIAGKLNANGTRLDVVMY